MQDPQEELRSKVALSCRILAMMGLVKEITGHVSARIPGSDQMFIRCRGVDEYGLPFTSTEAVQRVDFDGDGPDASRFGRMGEVNYEVPAEFPIHGEILRARPEVNCVIHAHPPGILLCGIADVELRPIIGTFDVDAMLLAEEGIPVFPSSRLITSSEIAAPLVTVMGDKNVCILKAHGIAVAGRSVEEATVRAIKLESLARVSWEVAKSGRQAPDISREDIDGFVLSRQLHETDRPYAANWIWRYYVKMLQEGRRIPNDIALGIDGI